MIPRVGFVPIFCVYLILLWESIGRIPRTHPVLQWSFSFQILSSPTSHKGPLIFHFKRDHWSHLKTLSTNYYPQHWLLECLIHSTNSILDVIHNNVINSHILLNNRNIYSQKLGTHIPTVILLLFLYYSLSLLISCKYVHCTYINVLYNSQNTYIVLCNFRTKGSFIQVYTPIRVEWCEDSLRDILKVTFLISLSCMDAFCISLHTVYFKWPFQRADCELNLELFLLRKF